VTPRLAVRVAVIAGAAVAVSIPAADRPDPSAERLRGFVQAAVARAQELQGWLILYDEQERANRDFRFVEFTGEEVRRTGADRWVLSAVCANRRGRRFVLDFGVLRDGGGFRLDRSRIRGPEGKPRYRWRLGDRYWEMEAGTGASGGSPGGQGARQGSPRS